MDLLKTLLIYLTMLFAASAQSSPDATEILLATPEPTPYVAPATATPEPTPIPTPVPTIDITPNPAYITLRVGDKNEMVQQMQLKLIEYGYLDGEADGVYGNQTRKAVEAFQYQHGLSADGIAGRRTLTVLYESPEIRLASAVAPTVEPTATAQLALAITPAPTAEPKSEPTSEPTIEPTPVPTPDPTLAPTPVPTVEPTPVPVETVKVITHTATPKPTPEPVWDLEPMTDYDIHIAVNGKTIKAHPCKAGETIYLPLVEILEAMDVLVLSTSSIDQDELAFARGEDLIRLAYSEDQQGEPIHLEVFFNTEPQLMPTRDVRRADGSIYLPCESFTVITGLNVTMDDAAKTATISQ